MKRSRLSVRKRNNDGSTLIIVLVVVALIAILGTTTIASAMLNYKMKTVDREAKKSFYTAEEAVDQVYAGLGKLCMENLNLVYTKQMTTITRQEVQDGVNISYQVSNEQCNKELRVDFADRMMKALFQTYTWDRSNTNVLIPDTVDTAIGVKTVKDILNSYIEDTTKLYIKSVGKQYLNVSSSVYPGMFNYVIQIKDCAVEYKNADGYFANVTVDINLGMPDIKVTFIDDADSQLTTFEDFAIIGNIGININSAQSLTVNDTKIFAGKAGGLAIGDTATLNTSGATIVTPGAVTVGADIGGDPNAQATIRNAKFYLSLDSRLWCMDLVTPANSQLGTIQVAGSAFVRDDLDVDGKNNLAQVSGNYVGFSYEGNAAGTAGHTNSSAMIVNGDNCRLDMQTVTSLILGGRSYIDISGQASYMTGESVSLRANQEIYLIPDAFLRKKSDGTKYYSNPVAVSHNSDVNVEIPDSFFAKSYLTAAQVRTVDVAGFRYYYFDIRKDKTNDYVNAIVNYSPVVNGVDVYRDNLKKLLMADITELQQQSLLKNAAGASIYANGSLIHANLDVSGKIDSISAQTTGTNFGLGEDSFVSTSKDLTTRFDLVTKMLYESAFFADGTNPNGQEALTAKTRNLYLTWPNTIVVKGKKVSTQGKTDDVFANFINKEYLEEKTALAPYVPAEQTDTSPFKVYITSKKHNSGTLVVDGTAAGGHVNISDGLIITSGNVVVRQNFNGLIIADGTVSIDSSVTVTNTYKDINAMLSKLSEKDREEVQKFFNAWQGSSEEVKNPLDYNISGITYRNIVEFDNWRKSAPQIVGESASAAE